MQKSQSPEIKALSVTHLALLIGQVLLALILLFVVYNNGFSSAPLWQSNGNLFILLCAAIGVAGYLGGNIMFRKKLEQINGNMKPVPEKFNEYRAACINRWALLEIPVLFCIILFYVTNNSVIILLVGVFILLFLTLRPSLQKAASDMGISEVEIQQMNAGNSSGE
jgi:hypothetical protein